MNAGSDTALVERLGEHLRSSTHPLHHASVGALTEALDACGLRLIEAEHPAVPHYCKPCGETLTEAQSVCPFCGRDATPVDEMPFVCSKGGCPLGGDL